MLALRIPQDMENRLNSLASMTGRTKTYYVKRAISELLEDMEDIFLAIEALSQKDIPIPHDQIILDHEKTYAEFENNLLKVRNAN